MRNRVHDRRGSFFARLWSTAPAALVLALVATLPGCGDFLSVENESDILDQDLDTELAVDALANGVAGDFNWAYHYVAYMSGHLADELLHTGSDTGIRAPSEGRTQDVLTWAGRAYDRPVMAVFVAEDAVRRFTEEIFDDPEAHAPFGTVHAYAGFGLLLSADNLCQVTIAGGPPIQPSEIYARAEEHFTTALAVAQRVGDEQLKLQALAGRARARVAQEKWADGLADARQIPHGFEHWAIYSTNSAREENIIASRGRASLRKESGTHPRYYQDPRFQSDPRTPFIDLGPDVVGADGLRQFVEQDKYQSRDSDMLISSWEEVRLLEAEAELNLGNLARTVELINEVRANVGLDPYEGAQTREAIFDQLIYERAAELWLQAQRLRDLRRTNDPYTQGRDVCYPISITEDGSNPNT